MGINNYAGSVDGARTIELWDIWLPSKGIIVTLPAPTDTRGIKGIPLKVVEWEGPEAGPYHLLSFCDVPGNLMPLPLVATMQDLHNLGNVIFRKLARQAERQKTIVAVTGGSEDGARIRESNDGEAITVDNPGNVKQISFGGPSPENQVFATSLRDQFSYYQGNLDSIGGLGAQSKTATQDEMLAETSSKRIDDMNDQFMDFTTHVMRSIGFYIWTDPVAEYSSVHTINPAGLKIDIPILLKPEERTEDFYRFSMDLVPHSMAPMTPQRRLSQLTNILETFILPFAEPLAMQGVNINYEELMKIVADLSSLDELKSILTFTTPMMQDQVAPAGGVAGGADGGRNYKPKAPSNKPKVIDRVNRSETTRPARDASIAASLMGNGGQNNNQSQSHPIGAN